MIPVALTIGGSDPSGGAGIQADLKTFHQLRAYGEAAITLITIQNTVSVSRVEMFAPELVIAQVDAVISDIQPGAAKTGALGSAEIVEAVAEASKSWTFPLVVDPVMISKHGAPLLSDEAQRAMRELLVTRAYLVMPNLDEAEALTALRVRSVEEMRVAAHQLRDSGAKNVLVKGGHLAVESTDLLLAESGEEHLFRAERIDTHHTHGTGCTYSAAITALLARGMPLVEAVAKAKRFITEAIRTNPGLGAGNGPVNHWAEAE